MNRFNNIALIVVASVMLFSVIGYRVVAELPFGINAPSESLLEGRSYFSAEVPTVSDVVHHRFQEDFEQCVADAFPMRESALLTYAGLQRAIIEIANIPYGFEIYPACFDSNYYCWPSQKRMLSAPDKKPDEFWETSTVIVEGCSEAMSNHSDIRWVFYLVDRASSSPASPAFDYVNDACDLSYFENEIMNRLPDDCTFISGRCETKDDLLKNYMATDHHWNVYGAVDAYERIVKSFGIEPIAFQYYEAFDGPCYGSSARSGKCIEYSEPMVDVSYARSDLSVKVNGEAVDESFLDKGFDVSGAALLTEEQKSYDSYASWFHPIVPFIEITNESVDSGSLLLINDSFGNNMQRFFAEHYRKVYVIDPRQYEGSIEEFVATHQIDDAVVLLSTVSLLEDSAKKPFE